MKPFLLPFSQEKGRTKPGEMGVHMDLPAWLFLFCVLQPLGEKENTKFLDRTGLSAGHSNRQFWGQGRNNQFV